MMESQSRSTDGGKGGATESVEKLRKELTELKATLAKKKEELEDARTRSVDLSDQYGSLREEHDKLTKKIAVARS